MPKRTDTSAATKEKSITEYRFFKQLCELPFVDAVYLYGSRARGDADTISDYDLAIDCPTASFDEWQRLKLFLEDAPFLNKIDITRYDTLEDGLYKSQIDKYKRPLYAKN